MSNRLILNTLSKLYMPKPGSLSEPLQDVIVLARLLGMSTAKDAVERKKDKGLRFKETDNSFFQEIPSAYQKAVEFFRKKLNMSKKEFNMLEAELRRAAFTIYLDSRETVLEMARESLERALESGMAREQWVDEIMEQFDRIGVTAVNPSYYDMVFRTNIQEGLNRGKDEIYKQTDKEEFPMYQWFTVGDNRVRDAHAPLDGFTWDRNDPIWQLLKPPLSYNCRCARSLVHSSEGLAASSAAQYSRIMSLIRGGRGFEFVI